MAKLFLSCLLTFILFSCSRRSDITNNVTAVADSIKPIEDSIFFKKVKFNLPPAIDSVVHTYTNSKDIRSYYFLKLYVFKNENYDEYIIFQSPNMEELEDYPSLFYDMFDSTYVFLYTGTENLLKEKTHKVVVPTILRSKLHAIVGFNDFSHVSYFYDNYTRKIIKTEYTKSFPMQKDSLEIEFWKKIKRTPPDIEETSQ